MQRLELEEREYRKLGQDSFTSIKLFIDDRNKYYKKHILGQAITEEDETSNDNLRVGSLVDCLLFNPDNLEDKFVTTSSTLPPKQMLNFVNNLYKRTLENTVDGRVTRELSLLIEDAYNDTKYNKDGEIIAFKRAGSFEKLKEDFIVKKIGYDYYLDLRNRGNKFVITMGELENAKKTVDILRMHKYTRDILNPGSDYTVYNQLILAGEYNDLPVKCMVDTVLVNEKTKTVYSYDLKTTWNVDHFEKNYLKYKYYLQCALYTAMLQDYFEGYTVMPMRFLVVDKIGYMDPVIYKIDPTQMDEAHNGFSANQTWYIGLDEAIEDIKYHIETGIWTSAADVQRQQGLRSIKLY